MDKMIPVTFPVPFHPAVERWFSARFGDPTPPQRDGWPPIVEGRHTLIAAPTGSGKTLAAFLSAIDSLVRAGSALPDETAVLYVSPLRALSIGVPTTSIRLRSRVPTPRLSARRSVLSHFSNGGAPRSAIGSRPITAVATASVQTQFIPATSTPGCTA